MHRSLGKKVWLAGAVGLGATILYTTYRLLVSSLVCKAVVIVVALACYYVPQLSEPIMRAFNLAYHKTVYENSIFWELFYDLTVKLFPSADVN